MIPLERRSLCLVTSFALVALASVSASAQTPSEPVVLQDGTTVPGATVTSVHVGVDVTLRLPDGSVRTYPWSAIRAEPSAPAANPTAPSDPGVRVQVAVGPLQQDETPDVSRDPRPGLVPVQLEASGAPIVISAILDPDRLGVVPQRTNVYGSNGYDPVPHRYLCSTPCTLYLRPGGTTLHLTGERQIPSDTTVVAHPGGDRIVLRSVSMVRPVGGILAALMGTMFDMSGLAMVAIGGFTNPTTTTGSVRTSDRGEVIGVGVGLLAVGIPLVIGGVHLLSSSRTGVERAAPLEPELSRASPRIRWLGANVGRTTEGAWMATTGVAF